MKILVDIDETLNDLIETLLTIYNEKYNDNVQITDITEYYIQKFLKPECVNIFTEFMSCDLIKNLHINEFAEEALNKAAEKHDIYFITAAFPQSVVPKHKWLLKHFKFYNLKNLIVCHDKSLIQGDIIIDDCSEHVEKSPCMHKIVFDKAWNKDCKCQYRLKTWADFDKYFRCVEEYHNFIGEVERMSSFFGLTNCLK